jgi:hypothetical protein
MSEASKDQTIMKLMEILESLKAEIQTKTVMIAELEKSKVPHGIPIALSQIRQPTTSTAPEYRWTPNNYPELNPQTRAKIDTAVEMAIKLGKKELRFR